MKLGQNFVDILLVFWAMEFQEEIILRFTDLYYSAISNFSKFATHRGQCTLEHLQKSLAEASTICSITLLTVWTISPRNEEIIDNMTF